MQGNIKQHWLILSHCFNMDGRAASQTITDKLPYLVKAGIEPIILSGVSGEQDKNYLHYQFVPWGPSGLRFDLRHVIASHLGRGYLYKLVVGLMGLLLAPFIVVERGLLGLQSQWSWALPATLRSLWLIHKYKPTILYTTGGAYSAHLAGYWIKRMTGIRWIVEVHDPMVKPGTIPVTRDDRFNAYIESRICHYADLAWWFTEGALKGARTRHPELGDRGIVILPGVAKPSVVGVYHRGKKMIISHFGSLSDTRSLKQVVAAMSILIKQKPEIRAKINVHIYGSSIDKASKAEIAKHGFEDVFISFGRLERSAETGMSGRDQVLQHMFQAGCLLLVHGTISDCSEYIPSKLYEYFWAGRPVLALTYQNPQLDQLVIERNGYVAHGDMVEDIARVLAKAYSDWEFDRLSVSKVPAIGVQQAVTKILDKVATFKVEII
jgi:glycosyltransferase involved in cell wall biosynthesis